MMKKVVQLIKKNLFKLYKVIFEIAGILLSTDKNLIIFESFHGKQYSDNPRAIYEYLKEHYPNYQMYWSAERKSLEKLKHYDIKLLRRFSLRWLFKMNRAQYWVTNSRLPLWIPKPKNTVYIQTWHGTPLKRLAADMDEVHIPGTNTVRYKRNFLIEANKWDYLISPNRYSTKIFKRAFNFNRKIIESGYPRNDYLINYNNPKEIEKIKQKLGLNRNKKIIMYAPTWRDNQFYGLGRYKFKIPMDLDKLQKELSSEYIVILRLHYLIAENLDLSQYKGFIYDFTFYDDLRKLYLISDILITDYSSVFFDYAILKRPMIFYTYDIEEYRDNLRGFYFDIEKFSPGPLVKNTNELINAIEKTRGDFKTEDKLQTFYESYCYLEDGEATKRVIENVFK